MIRVMVKCIIQLFLYGFMLTCHALPNDRTALIHLTADTISLEQHQHHGTYKGNVMLDQGSTHLRADTVITENNDKNQLTKAIALGNKTAQAHVWALTSEDKPELHAYANQLIYDSAPHIEYDTLTEHVTTQHEGMHRTTLIVDPKGLS